VTFPSPGATKDALLWHNVACGKLPILSLQLSPHLSIEVCTWVFY